MRVQLQLHGSHEVLVRFPYDPGMVEQIKARCAQRRWDPDARGWAVHLAELPLLTEIFELSESALPPDLRAAYQEHWAAGTVELRIGAATCSLAGAHLPLDDLEAATSYAVQGAEFTPAYEAGEWDGHRRLLRREDGLRFPTGLLARVRALLAEHGLRVRERDERPPLASLGPARPVAGSPLRDYQQQAVRDALAARRGVLQLATGAGKTLIAAHLIAHCHAPTIFFVHTRDLLRQAAGVLSDVLGEPVGLLGEGHIAPRWCTVATIQTVARGLGLHTPDADDADAGLERQGREELIRQTVANADVIFFDECHHLPSETCYELNQRLERGLYRFGLSATPYRADGADLLIEAALGPVVATINASTLIRAGYLIQPKIVFLRMPPPPFDLARKNFQAVYDLAVVEHRARNERLAAMARAQCDAGHSVLLLVNQIRHGQRLAELLPQAVFLSGQDSGDARETALDDFRQGRQRILIATTLADEGLDLPNLDVLILAGAGRSETRALQRIGRALRPAPGKRRALVYDCWDETRYLDEHSRRRQRIYETEPLFEIEMEPEDPNAPKQGMLF